MRRVVLEAKEAAARRQPPPPPPPPADNNNNSRRRRWQQLLNRATSDERPVVALYWPAPIIGRLSLEVERVALAVRCALFDRASAVAVRSFTRFGALALAAATPLSYARLLVCPSV